MIGAEKVTLMDRIVECPRLEELYDFPLVSLISSASLGRLLAQKFNRKHTRQDSLLLT